jgi:hypothetical protein
MEVPPISLVIETLHAPSPKALSNTKCLLMNIWTCWKGDSLIVCNYIGYPHRGRTVSAKFTTDKHLPLA